MLEIRNLSKSFGYFRVWDDLSFDLDAGQIFGLFGVNGSGKTTLLKTIAGIVSPNSGEILIHGKDIRKVPAQRRHIGFLTHQSLYYHDLSCLENLRFTARLYKLDVTDSQLLERLRSTGLEKWANEPARYFSRGMLQRLAIAKSLLHDPDLILYDEPFTGLDEEASQMVEDTLREAASRGKTVLLVTHDLKQGFQLSDKIALLAGRRLLYCDEKDSTDFDRFHDLFRQPAPAQQKAGD